MLPPIDSYRLYNSHSEPFVRLPSGVFFLDRSHRKEATPLQLLYILAQQSLQYALSEATWELEDPELIVDAITSLPGYEPARQNFLQSQLVFDHLPDMYRIYTGHELDARTYQNYLPHPISWRKTYLVITPSVVDISTTTPIYRGYVVPFRWPENQDNR